MPSAAEHAYDKIRRGILEGRYRAGDRLPEQKLSDELGVSRTPLREALRRLSAVGIIEFLPHRGAHVASWTDRQLTDIFEHRALVEGYSARQAATRISDEDIERLDKLAKAMEKKDLTLPEDVEAVAELNNQFHRIIVNNAGSELLVNFAEILVQVALVHRTFRRYTTRDLRRSFGHHRELVEAFEVRDADWAEAVMRAHVLSARHVFDPDDEAEEDHRSGYPADAS